MITSEQLEKLNESTIELDDYQYMDVVVDGKEKTAMFFENKWYLIPVNFKFGNETHRGQPYLSMDQHEIEVVSLEFLQSLPVWNYEHVEGVLIHNGVKI